MLGWLRSLFGTRKPAKEDHPLVREAPGKRPAPPQTPAPQAPQAETLGKEDHGALLAELVEPRPEINLQGLSPEDRLFVSGVMKKVREKQLHVPVLPQAAMQISNNSGRFSRVNAIPSPGARPIDRNNCARRSARRSSFAKLSRSPDAAITRAGFCGDRDATSLTPMLILAREITAISNIAIIP